MRCNMALLCVAVAVGFALPAGATLPSDPGLTSWGTWIDQGARGWSFAANDTFHFRSTWANEDDKSSADKLNLTSPRAGGEWCDLEGLYVRLDLYKDPLDELKYRLKGLDFALITSFNGMDPQSPNQLLTHSNYNYRYSPVVAFDLDGITGYDHALVMDNRAWAGGKTSDKWSCDNKTAIQDSYKLDDVTATPSFYQVNAGDWKDASRDRGFGAYTGPNPVDFSGGVVQASKGNSWRYRSVMSDSPTDYYDEADNEQLWGLSGNSTDKSCWPQSMNWTWKGSLTFDTALEFSAADWSPSSAHISMPCGNDWITATYSAPPIPVDPGDPSVPEPSLGLLLLAGIVPLGIGLRRLGRRS